MLEALIRITDPSDDSKLKAKGDVVCVKLAGAVWGTQETKRFLRVQMDDAALEAQLIAMAQAGEPHPVITLPYREDDKDGNIITFSTKKLDIEKLDQPVKDSLADLTTDKPIVIKAKAEIKDKTADEKPIEIAKVN